MIICETKIFFFFCIFIFPIGLFEGKGRIGLSFRVLDCIFIKKQLKTMIWIQKKKILELITPDGPKKDGLTF